MGNRRARQRAKGIGVVAVGLVAARRRVPTLRDRYMLVTVDATIQSHLLATEEVRAATSKMAVA